MKTFWETAYCFSAGTRFLNQGGESDSCTSAPVLGMAEPPMGTPSVQEVPIYFSDGECYLVEPMAFDTIFTEYVPCDLCGSSDQVLLYSKIDPITRKEFHLVECACGMAFVNPMPTAESIPLLYPGDYLRDKTDLASLYGRMMTYLPVGRGKLLDIGCGRGDFINHASKEGWEVEGVDLMDWGTPHDVPIRVGDFLTMDFREKHYDAITAWALLEHVRAPSAFFKRVSQLLKDDGILVFAVPNFSAPGMKHCCTEDVPRHLWLFTPRAVEKYLGRYGMEVRAVFHNDALYTAYPFGLVRYGLQWLRKRPAHCSRYQNRSVALLRNRQIKGNATAWLAEVLKSVGPLDAALDLIDLALGVLLAQASKLIGNYGVITVVAGRNRQKKSNPK